MLGRSFPERKRSRKANETQQNASQMMHIYLGEILSLGALYFLSLAEGGELVHYEGLNAIVQGVQNLRATLLILFHSQALLELMQLEKPVLISKDCFFKAKLHYKKCELIDKIRFFSTSYFYTK